MTTGRRRSLVDCRGGVANAGRDRHRQNLQLTERNLRHRRLARSTPRAGGTNVHHWGFPVTTSSSRKGLPFVWRTPHISRQRALHGLPRPTRCSLCMTTVPRFPRVVDDVTVRLIAAVVLLLALVALDLKPDVDLCGAGRRLHPAHDLCPSGQPLARGVQRFVRPLVKTPKQPTAGAPKAVCRRDRRRPDLRGCDPVGSWRGEPCGPGDRRDHGRLPRPGVNPGSVRGVQGVRVVDEARARA